MTWYDNAAIRCILQTPQFADGVLSTHARLERIRHFPPSLVVLPVIRLVPFEERTKAVDVAECAVLGITDKLKGQIPIGLLALKAGVTKNKKEIITECVKMVREKVGPVAAFKIAVVVKRLPKTRSGKILRGTVRKIADNEPYKIPATIDDPAILDEIKADLIENNILKI